MIGGEVYRTPLCRTLLDSCLCYLVSFHLYLSKYCSISTTRLSHKPSQIHSLSWFSRNEPTTPCLSFVFGLHADTNRSCPRLSLKSRRSKATVWEGNKRTRGEEPSTHHVRLDKGLAGVTIVQVSSKQDWVVADFEFHFWGEKTAAARF